MKWPDTSLKLTQDYIGGGLVGFGMGLFMAAIIIRRSGGNIPMSVTFIVSLFFSIVGSTLAKRGQHKNT